MLRTALRPRWLGLLGVVLVAAAACGLLGAWQLGVARDKGRVDAVRRAPSLAVAPLDTLLSPHSAFPATANGRRVTTTGRYDGTRQVLVTPRVLDGTRGYWVVAPLVVDGTGARLAVVRGFVREPAAVVPPSSARVALAGVLAPGEGAARGDGAGLPEGQLPSVDLSALVNRWPGELYNALVFATSEQPDASATAVSPGAGAAQGMVRVPPPAVPAGGLAWRNAAYAFQWWVFGLFGLFLWGKMVRDEYQQGPRPVRPREAVHV